MIKMWETESSIAIQDEESGYTASVMQCMDDITINGIVALNADWSSINQEEEEQEEDDWEW